MKKQYGQHHMRAAGALETWQTWAVPALHKALGSWDRFLRPQLAPGCGGPFCSKGNPRRIDVVLGCMKELFAISEAFLEWISASLSGHNQMSYFAADVPEHPRLNHSPLLLQVLFQMFFSPSPTWILVVPSFKHLQAWVRLPTWPTELWFRLQHKACLLPRESSLHHFKNAGWQHCRQM